MIRYMPLSDVCKIIDCPHETPEWRSEGIPVIRNFNLINGQIDLSDGYYVDEDTFHRRTRRAVPSEGDIIFSREAPIGNCGIVPKDFKCCLGQRLVLLKVNHTICSSEYLLAVLQSPYVLQQIAQVSKRGSIVSNFAIGDLQDLMVPILDNQDDIAKLSSTISEKISNNGSLNEVLESMAKLLFDFWFVQFDFPDEKGNPYKSSGGKMVWNDELKREIPEGWEVKPFKEIAVFTMGQSPKGDNYNLEEKGLPLLNGAAELTKNGIHIEKYTEEYNRVCSVGDWLFCVRATLGNINIAKDVYCLGRGVAAATPKTETYSEYVYFNLNSMISHFEKSLSGSIIVGMTKDDIIDYFVICPPEGIVKSFHEKVRYLFSKKEENKIENQQLASLRDFLLPMLINGQVKINE